jgi:hypothetical protein
MNDQRTPDDVIRAWVRSGPEAASSDLIERTMKPVPRMRQRRSWRIGLTGALGPVARPLAGAAGLVFVVAVAAAVVGRMLLGTSGVGSAPSEAPTKPTFELRILGGVGEGTYVSDPAANLSMCVHAADGSWRFQYVGGDPAVELDMLVGSGAGDPGGSSRVAAEVTAGAGYFRFDPADMRGGDVKGRSTASVAVADGPGTTTFTITATTPDGGVDAVEPIDVQLTVTCPR